MIQFLCFTRRSLPAGSAALAPPAILTGLAGAATKIPFLITLPKLTLCKFMADLRPLPPARWHESAVETEC